MMERIELAHSHKKTEITAEERAAIDAYLAKNKVTKVARGVSGLPDPSIKLHWKDQREIMRRTYLRQKKFERAAQLRSNPKGPPITSAEDKALDVLKEAGTALPSSEVAKAISLSQRTTRKHLVRLVGKGLVETVGASCTTRYRVAA